MATAVSLIVLSGWLRTGEAAAPAEWLRWDDAFRVQLTQPGQVRTMAVQGDGRILIQGDFQWVGTAPRNGVARLYPDGALDGTFDPGRHIGGQPLALALLPDGRVVIAARVQWDQVALFRCDAQGRLDPTFAAAPTFTQLGFSGDVGTFELLPLPDGRMLVGGFFHHVGSEWRVSIARLLPNGALDPTFNAESAIDNFTAVTGIARDGDAGYLVSTQGPAWPPGFLRLASNGELKPGKPLTKEERQRLQLAVLADGRRVEVDGEGGVRLFSTTGAFQTRWRGVGAIAPLRSRHHAALTPDGNLLVAGYGPELADGRANFGLVRLTPTISPLQPRLIPGKRTSKRRPQPYWRARLVADHDFAMPGGVSVTNFGIDQLVREPSGTLLVRGNFTLANGVWKQGMARIYPDGTLDRSFNLDGILFPGRLAVTSEGAILVEGSVCPEGSYRCFRNLFRFAPSGQLDLNFSVSLEEATTLDLVPNGSGLLVYQRDEFFPSGSPWGGATRLKRLNTASGAWDPEFSIGITSACFDLLDCEPGHLEHILPSATDGATYLVGDFTHLNLSPAPGVGRILGTGVPDPAFQYVSPHAYSWRVLGAEVVDGGQLLLFTAENDGTARARIHRHGLDGALLSDIQVELPIGAHAALPLPDGAWLLRARTSTETSFHLVGADGSTLAVTTIPGPTPVEGTVLVPDAHQGFILGTTQVPTPHGLWSGLVRLH